MVLGDRPAIATSPQPITVADASALTAQLMVALARVPYREPWRGFSNTIEKMLGTVTREVLPAFIGYMS